MRNANNNTTTTDLLKEAGIQLVKVSQWTESKNTVWTLTEMNWTSTNKRFFNLECFSNGEKVQGAGKSGIKRLNKDLKEMFKI